MLSFHKDICIVFKIVQTEEVENAVIVSTYTPVYSILQYSVLRYNVLKYTPIYSRSGVNQMLIF